MSAVADWFRALYETTGINLTVFYDAYDFQRYTAGIGMTLFLSLASIAASVVIGAAGAAAQGSGSAVVRRGIQAFVVVFRNTPPLVQIFFFYFGVGAVIPGVETSYGTREPLIGNVAWAVISLSLFAGAFNVEIFRSGIEAVPRTTIEAAEALGYTRLGAYRHIVLPLALRVCLPALNNNLINLLKTTTLAYAIAVPETLYAAKQIWSESQNVLEMMLLLLATYMVLVGIFTGLMHQWERHMRIAGYHR